MKRFFGYIKSNKYSLLLLYWPIHTLWYAAVNYFIADKDVLLIHTTLDDKIIFNEWFVIPYAVWYFYIAATLIFTLLSGKKDFLRTCALVYPCMMIPMLFCTFVPNGISMAMRPNFDELGRSNLAIWLVKLIYAADTPPRSVMPSMHTTVSCALFASVCKASRLKGKWSVKAISGILSLLICLSTVFIKQHSSLDVMVGIALAALIIIAVLAFEYFTDRKKAKIQ